MSPLFFLFPLLLAVLVLLSLHLLLLPLLLLLLLLLLVLLLEALTKLLLLRIVKRAVSWIEIQGVNMIAGLRVAAVAQKHAIEVGKIEAAHPVDAMGGRD